MAHNVTLQQITSSITHPHGLTKEDCVQRTTQVIERWKAELSCEDCDRLIAQIHGMTNDQKTLPLQNVLDILETIKLLNS